MPHVANVGSCCLALCAALAADSGCAAISLAETHLSSRKLPELDSAAASYRTPRLGEGFRTDLFGEEVVVPARDPRHVTAWKLGAQFEAPAPTGRLVLPAGAFYLWRHPDERHLYRAEIAGVYNNVFWSLKPEDWGDFEFGFTFNNFTLPEAWSEVYDGVTDKSQQIYWGFVRPGFTLGYRQSLENGRSDNMWQINWVVEPGYFYSGRSSQTAADMVLPRSTFELRNRLVVRWDGLERNLLSLPHAGYAAGADFVQAFRTDWDDWGTPRYSFSKNEGQHYSIVNAYAVASGGIPFVDSERHRMVAWLHGAVGHNVDRFNAIRVGGGPNAMGMEYGASAMPVLPGTSIWEFYPEHYLIGALEYRWELSWFSYLSAHGGVGYLDPYRPTASGELRRSNELLPWMGARLSTGFIGDTMVMLDYAHSFNLVNQDTRGANEVMLWISGEL